MTLLRIVRLAPIMAALLGGCGSDSYLMDQVMVVPGYYDTLQCPELIGMVAGGKQQVKDLTALIAKSQGNVGGTVADVLAYNTDLAKARARLRAADEASKRKGCDQAAKPAVALPQPPPEPGPPTQPGMFKLPR